MDLEYSATKSHLTAIGLNFGSQFCVVLGMKSKYPECNTFPLSQHASSEFHKLCEFKNVQTNYFEVFGTKYQFWSAMRHDELY